ncbi:glycosyltransferase family 4 protein [Magnetospirillum sp. UT-4]|uniref:glycosyltransferase family 4 protein n=1 Tax=Magnetospirillum sp. UT-4 TaxID=2681467 RepID=UPI00137E3648|nr:glycosyltransferase family 4 protein [Magnetospirillum sp. UT-4]CAA7612086.1 Glycosyl transferase, group 1 [Magnetospirillum sp. UT-4]
MRILHTIPGRNWGGMEHRTIEQVRWLESHGHAVWLAAPGDGEPYGRARDLGLPVLDFDFDRPWRPATMMALRALVRERRIEVIDSHVTRDAKAALGCMDLCAVVRSRHVNQPLKPSLIRRLQWRLSDHVITVAECTRDHLIHIGLADPTRSTAIGGWADERFFDLPDPVATRARLRAEIGLGAGATVLLCVGMLRPDKGQDHLVAALALLKARGVEPSVVLAGSATAESAGYEADLRAAASRLGLDARFLGYRDDVSQLMQAADLVVIPSLTEAQPRVAVQAFATGKPVVASAVGGVPEIVKDGETGWLVPPADPVALADAIAAVLADPATAGRVAANARRIAEQAMRFDHRMAQTLEIYRIAIARARRRPVLRAREVTP